MISVDTKSKWASGVTRSVSFLSVPLPLAPSLPLSSQHLLTLPEPTYLYLIFLLSFSLSFSKELSPQDVCIPDFRAPVNPEACCPTLLKPFSVPHGGLAVTSGFTRSTGTFYSSLSLTLWAALGWTSPLPLPLSSWPLVFSWLPLLIFCASSPEHLCISMPWDQCWTLFSSYRLS